MESTHAGPREEKAPLTSRFPLLFAFGSMVLILSVPGLGVAQEEPRAPLLWALEGFGFGAGFGFLCAVVLWRHGRAPQGWLVLAISLASLTAAIWLAAATGKEIPTVFLFIAAGALLPPGMLSQSLAPLHACYRQWIGAHAWRYTALLGGSIGCYVAVLSYLRDPLFGVSKSLLQGVSVGAIWFLLGQWLARRASRRVRPADGP
jgi:hypothetical protein